MNHAYLLTGGNLGDRAEMLQMAIDALAKEAGNILQVSGLYETAAWGKTNQPAYLNQAILLETALSPLDLLKTMLGIEQKLGRIRQEKYGARVIDIDLLFYNQEIIHLENLQVPHPQMHKRRFVLVPLAEIAEGYQHPINGKTVEEMLENCPDPLDVKKFSGPVQF